VSRQHRASKRRRWTRVAAVVVVGLLLCNAPLPKASAFSFQRISGEGSSWAFNAIEAMRVNVKQFGISVDYAKTGSTAGRVNYLNGIVDFAASDIPFQFHPEDGSAPENPEAGSYAYIPVTAGGTAFMYNLRINGKRVTNLRLSGENISKIFTGVITTWNDPAIQADNPGLVMPATTVVPVVRSDGSGSSAQFTLWMINQYPDLWNDFCNRSGRAPACGETSFYPNYPGMIAQAGDDLVAAYVSQGFAEGTIGYVNYSYALNTQFPVVKLLNKAGYYTEPTPENVAVSLLQAQINDNAADPTVYLTQKLDGVYNDTDPRSYQLSSYSYLIVPTKIAGDFNVNKGETLGAFSYYAMCQAQQQSASLGYSPMPINLVEASFDQIRKIPGVVVQDIEIASCNNPTFSPDGSNLLADNAPQPQLCDKQSQYQCPNGTAGQANVPTEVSAAATLVVGGAPAAGDAGAGDAGAGAGSGSADPGAAASDDGTGAAGNGTGAGSGTGSSSGTGAGSGTGTAGAGNTTGSTVVPGATPSGTGTSSSGNEAQQSCDPDSGTCSAASNDAGSGGASAPAAVGAIQPTTLDQSSGWSTSLLLMILVIALTLALVLAPAVFWRYVSTKAPA
jgi:ABC-type phosphate transport system substrate-binding protein